MFIFMTQLDSQMMNIVIIAEEILVTLQNHDCKSTSASIYFSEFIFKPYSCKHATMGQLKQNLSQWEEVLHT